jgi:hypothetical protein
MRWFKRNTRANTGTQTVIDNDVTATTSALPVVGSNNLIDRAGLDVQCCQLPGAPRRDIQTVLGWDG